MPEKAFDKKEYDRQYIKQNIKLVPISFNRSKPEDMRMLQWLKARPEGISAYIKALVKQHMLIEQNGNSADFAQK